MLVLIWAAGITTGVATAYQTANSIPNLIFELVAGGALAALVVPLLAAPLARHRPDQVNHIASALLTWALTILIPVAVLVAVFARPLILLVGSNLQPATIDAATEMLVYFAPQLPLYGIAVVLTGVLQAHRRFAWPALAPLLSGITMIGVYLLYGIYSDKQTVAGHITDAELALLAGGTTCGVLVLAGCLLIPLRGLHLKFRPAWRLETHVASDIRALAIAGAITLGAQQLCQALLIRLANNQEGNVTVFALAQTFFLLPWAVLAVPLATAVYPGLSESHALGDSDRFHRSIADTGRTVLVLSGLGVAALAGLAEPIGAVLAQVAANGGNAEKELAATLTGISFGLFGYSMFAIYSRGLYALGRPMSSALATAIGWAAAAVAAVILAQTMAESHRTLALSIAWTIGMTVIGLALTIAIARHTGAASLAGLGRAALATLGATAAAIAAARGLIAWWGSAGSTIANLTQGIAVGAVTAVVYLGIAALVGGTGVVGLISRRAGRIRASEESEAESGEHP